MTLTIENDKATKALAESLSKGLFDDRFKRPKNDNDKETKRVQKLLAAGAAVDNPELMVHCCASRCLTVVQMMVEAGADVNGVTDYGSTPLMSCGDNYQITQFLLKHKAEPNAVDKKGRNALHHAARRFCDSSPAIRVLLKAGIDIESKDNDGMTALMLACRTNRADTVVSLLEKGADIDAVDNKGVSVTQHAIDGGYRYPVYELNAWRGLVGFDPDVNRRDSKGRTPLMSAPLQKRTVNHLLKAGADLQIVDDQGMTPLMHHAGSRYSDAAVVKILIEAGSQLEARDCTGRTALIHCARSYSRIMFFDLVKLGADIHAKDNSGWGVLEHSKDAEPNEIHGFLKEYFSKLTRGETG